MPGTETFRHGPIHVLRASLAGVAILAAATACGAAPVPVSAPLAPTALPADAPYPALKREFRGVWIASVANIDWPSRPGLTTAEQQGELIAMLDRAVEAGLNGIVLQVRPAADALYESPYEPWSEYLTGEMGRAPDPYYDPLEFAVTEAHRRGLELHAWFNPYRARHPSAESPISDDHISRTRPELVHEYGNFLWMDPAEPEVQQRSLDVMLDVVRRYDVDGIHIDDYFYPYPVNDADGRPLDFPDEAAWERYVAGGGTLDRGDWRRRNVDVFIERLYREIKREKPHVRFGISPFGIWRPGHPPQIQTGFDQYGVIYADARKWLVEGWLDYYAPQLYWPIGQTPQSYPVLLRWWVEHNPLERHMWPGNFTSRVFTGAQPHWPAREILGQIYVTRGQPGATGNIHFSMRALMIDPDSLVAKLRDEAYVEPALAPASHWLTTGPAPGAPRVTWTPGATTLALEAARGGAPWWWVVRSRDSEGWRTQILPAWQTEISVAGDVAEVAVSAVDRVGVEGAIVQIGTAATAGR
jgi:uncharacterized lipoprotein YddW (UPF0748 family)